MSSKRIPDQWLSDVIKSADKITRYTMGMDQARFEADEIIYHLTRQEFVMADFDKPSADAIFYTQKRRLATIPADHPELLRLGRALVAFATTRGGASIVESQP